MASLGTLGDKPPKFKMLRVGRLFLPAADPQSDYEAVHKKFVTDRSFVTGFSPKSGSYTAVASDKGKCFELTSTFTLSLDPAATLGSGWYCSFNNLDTGVITVDPNGAETINGKANIKIRKYQSGIIVCDGTKFSTIGFSEYYVSPAQTITSAGALTLAHELGVKPRGTDFTLSCVTAQYNYSIGDEIDVSNTDFTVNATRLLGHTVEMDATNIYIYYSDIGTVYNAQNASTRAVENLTNANWNAIFRAYL